MIDWAHFTPWASLAGGLLIGLAAALFIVLHGRIMGISGIVSGTLFPMPRDTAWRFAFLLGVVAAPVVWSWFAPLPNVQIDAGFVTLVIAGVLVGVGTRLGSGCTSGHGVCGLARLSPRSLVATLAFMASGFLTVYVVRHLLA